MKKFSYENYARRITLGNLISLYRSIQDTGVEDKSLEKIVVTRIQQIFDTEEPQKIKLKGNGALCNALAKKRINGRHIIRAKLIDEYYCLPNGDIYNGFTYMMSIKPYSNEDVVVNDTDIKKKKKNKIRAIKAQKSKDKIEEEINNKFYNISYYTSTYLYAQYFVNKTVGKKKDFTKGRYFDAIPEPYKLLEKICLTLEQTKDASMVSDLLKDELYARDKKWKSCCFYESRMSILIDLLHACGVRPGHYVYYKRDGVNFKSHNDEIDFLESHSKINVFRPKIIDKNSTIGSDKDIGKIYIDMEETKENKKMEYLKGPITYSNLHTDAEVIEVADAYSLFKKIMDKEENKDQKEFYQSIKVIPSNKELKKEENKE